MVENRVPEKPTERKRQDGHADIAQHFGNVPMQRGIFTADYLTSIGAGNRFCRKQKKV